MHRDARDASVRPSARVQYVSGLKWVSLFDGADAFWRTLVELRPSGMPSVCGLLSH